MQHTLNFKMAFIIRSPVTGDKLEVPCHLSFPIKQYKQSGAVILK